MTFLFCLNSNAHANHFEQWSLLSAYGEGVTSSEYEGPLWPAKKYSRREGILTAKFEDEEGRQLLINSAREIFELENFWFHVFPEKEMCTDELFDSKAHFMQYLFRLISLSYSYETLKDIQIFLAHLSARNGASDAVNCSVEPTELWKNCHPKYVEMQKFLKRAQHESQTDMLDKLSFARDKKSLDSWWTEQIREINGQNKVNSISSEILFERYKNISSVKKMEVTDAGIKKILIETCQSIKKDMKLVCNEKDSLFGMSRVPEAKLLIERSHSFTQLNKSGHGSGCLKRFVNLLSRLEQNNSSLQVMFPAVMQSLLKQGAPYLQGKLFLLGSLQEFEEKGLVGLLYEEKKAPTPAPVVIAAKKEVVKTPTPEPVKAVTVVTPKPVATPEPTPLIKLSQFEAAVEERYKLNLDRAPVNMQLMRLDYPFTDKMIVELSGPIKDFQTRQALKDMRELDKLGSKEEPMHLMFLKFLIDNDYHQGLFNIQSEIGQKFWVVNDFENSALPQLIELVNDESTQNHWQIYILRPVLR